jgi:hypothetical protein
MEHIAYTINPIVSHIIAIAWPCPYLVVDYDECDPTAKPLARHCENLTEALQCQRFGGEILCRVGPGHYQKI